MTATQTSDLTRVAEDFISTFNSGDWDRFQSLMSSDVMYKESGTQRQTDDVDTYLQLCRAWKQAFPDANGTIDTMMSSGNMVAMEITWEGTHTGDLPVPNGTLPPTNRGVKVPAVLWLIFQGDHVQEVHHHLDVLTMLQQLGAMSGS